jgi:hypothetical protein
LPARFFPSLLQGVGHDLVQLIGCFPHGADRSHAHTVWLSLAYFTQEQTGGLGHRVIDRCEPAVMHGGLDRAFKIMGQMDRRAYLIAYSPKPIS